MVLIASIAGAAPMLVTEISYPSYRAPLTSAYNSLWYSGAIVYVHSFLRHRNHSDQSI